MPQGHDTMLNDRPLRVLVVDDHAGIRLGISRLIDAEAPRMCSVGAVGSIRQALAHTGRCDRTSWCSTSISMARTALR